MTEHTSYSLLILCLYFPSDWTSATYSWSDFCWHEATFANIFIWMLVDRLLYLRNIFTNYLTLNTQLAKVVQHTHTRSTALFPGLPSWAATRKVKPIWILLKQETVNGSGISWAICKSAPRSRQITTPAPHHSVFLQAGCPSCRPTNSVKALKASKSKYLYSTQ